jgi:hypothetical protein
MGCKTDLLQSKSEGDSLQGKEPAKSGQEAKAVIGDLSLEIFVKRIVFEENNAPGLGRRHKCVT